MKSINKILLLGVMVAGVYTSPSQAQNTITNGLAAYWNFAEPSGTPVVLDVSGNGNNGQMFNFALGSERSPGIVGQALYFGGPSTLEYIQITNCNIRPTSTMSLAVWVNVPASFSWSSSPWTTIVKNWPGTAANEEAYFGLNGSAGTAVFYLNNSSIANVHATETTALPQGQWVHLAFTADGAYLNIYRNGVYEVRTAYNGTINTNILTNTMGIGVELTNGGLPYAANMGYWQGWMDDLAIWGRALSAAEIQSIYLAGKAGIPLTNAYAYLTLTAYTAAQNVYANNSAVFSVANSSGSSLGYQWQVTDGVSLTNNLTNGLTLSGSTIFGATAATLTVSNVSSADAGSYYTCLITNAASSATNSPLAPLTLLVSTNMPVTRPGDSITDFYSAIGTADPYPSGLGAADIIDGTLAPYLNYGEYGEYNMFSGPVGYVVTPSLGGSVVTAARIYTSTNSTLDDPADFTLYGSNDGLTWSLIATTPISLPFACNASSGTINSNNQVLQEIDFPNTKGYYQYAVYFTNVVGLGADSLGLEFAEVQLLGVQSLQRPDFVVQPSPAVQPLQIGGSMTWSVVAGGVGVTYQWYQGSTNNPIAGATNASYTLANVTTNLSGYFCVATDSNGSTTSSNVSVNVLAPTSPYVSTVMADKPIAFFRLDEGPDNGLGDDGMIAYDSVGGHDGVYTNAILQVPGYSIYDSDDYAAAFGEYANPNSYVGQINGVDFSSPAGTTNFSMEAWVNLAALFENGDIVSKGGPGASAGNQFALDMGGTGGAFRCYFFNASGGQYPATSTVVPSLNTWYHLVGVVNESANAVSLYINGVLAANWFVPTGVGVLSTPLPLTIGSALSASGTYSYQVDGSIANVAFYNYALSAAQVVNHYTAFLFPSTFAQNVYAGKSALFTGLSLGTNSTYQWQITDGLTYTNNLTNGPTGTGSTILGATTSTLTVSNVSSSDAVYYTCFTTSSLGSTNSPAAPLTLLVSTNMLITRPGDPITDFTTAIGTPIPYPSGLAAADILDGTLAPYLNYGANGQYNAFAGPVGYVVTPSIGASLVTAARIYTSTNAQADDPADFTLYGSNDGLTWSLIATTPLALPFARNASAGTINSNNQVLHEIDFPNAKAYYEYAVYFTNAVGGAAAVNGLEFAEVQLLGAATLQAPPYILTQSPANQPLQMGVGSMTWSVVAEGSAPLAYQWYQGSTNNPIAGATNASYTLANITANVSGYFCVVTNAYGSARSSSKSVSVLAPTGPYVSVVMADKPIAFYRLDEGPDNGAGNNGVIAYDSVGARDGVYNNVILQQPGYSSYDPDDVAAAFGQYPNTTTLNSYVKINNGVDFSSPATTPANFSVEAWVNFQSKLLGAGIVSKAGYVANTQQFALDTGDSTANDGFRLFFYNANAVAAGVGSSTAVWSLNTWYHLVGVLNESGNAMYLYTNGVLEATTTLTAAQAAGVQATTWPLTIGSRPGSAGAYTYQVNGSIANVALYNYAMSSSQVLNHYGVANGGPGLVEVPTNTTVYQAETATFYSSAVGPAPLTYQWQLNGVPLTNGPSPSGTGAIISGATSSNLSIAGVTLADSGETYSVVVANSVGATPAAAATLTVGGVVLATEASGTNLVLVWPSGTSGYQLQSNTNLANTNGWVNVTNSVSVVNGQIQVTVPLSGKAMFFRVQWQ